MTSQASAAGSTGGGAAASRSGAGGKRNDDPRVRAQLRMRLALQTFLRPVWLLRTQMSFVIDALLSYWQSDVVASAFAELLSAAAAAPNFMALLRAHDAYTQRLRAGAFLSLPSVSACVERLLAAADSFAAVVLRAASSAAASVPEVSGAATAAAAGGGSGLVGLMHPERGRPQLLAHGASFTADTKMLQGLLFGAAEHLDCTSLLTRLNFNQAQ